VDRAVLDLFASGNRIYSGEIEMWARNLSCFYQAEHGRPLPGRCISTDPNDRRASTQDRLAGLLMTAADGAAPGALEEIPALLRRENLGAVAVHVDFLRPIDADGVLSGLTLALGPAAADTRDGGERVVLFVVQDPGGHR
jgi:hypothetical protein